MKYTDGHGDIAVNLTPVVLYLFLFSHFQVQSTDIDVNWCFIALFGIKAVLQEKIYSLR